MIEAPRITRLDARDIAVIHMTIPRAEMMSAFAPAIEELMTALATQRASPAGPVFAHHLRIAPGIFDFEVGVAVDSPVRASGRMKPAEMPAARVARTIYQGPYDGLASAWGEFDAWMKAEKLRQADDLWEVYTVGPETTSDSEDWRTELNRPLLD